MNRGDRMLLILPLALTAIGVVMVYSSSAILGITRYQDPNHFLFKQLFRAGLGVVVLLAFTRIPLRFIERQAPRWITIATFLLVLVAVVGRVSHGAGRWITVHTVSLQPTDLARFAAVAFVAWWLKRNPPAELGFKRGVLPALGVIGGLAGLIILQPNLSSATLLALTGFAMVYFAGARLRHLAIPIVVAVLAGAVVVLTHPYMMERVVTFRDFLLHGTLDAKGAGWQLDQSLIAIGSGGTFGRGLGAGRQKYLFLPEAHTDFIFSVLAEEMGFVGSVVLLGLIALLLWRGMRTAARATDSFPYLLAGGLTFQLGLYALVNLAVATGLTPTTGLPLPFVSYGGSALIVNLAAAGVLYRVSVANDANEVQVRQRWSREMT